MRFLGRSVVAGSMHIFEMLHVVGTLLLALAMLVGVSVTFDLAKHAPAVIGFWAVAIVAIVIVDGAYLEWIRASELTQGTLWHAEIGDLSATATVPDGYTAMATARGESLTVRVSPPSRRADHRAKNAVEGGPRPGGGR
jgi:hypothetical protein